MVQISILISFVVLFASVGFCVSFVCVCVCVCVVVARWLLFDLSDIGIYL